MGILVHLDFPLASWEKGHFSIVIALPFARQKEVWKPGFHRVKPWSNGRFFFRSRIYVFLLNVPGHSHRNLQWVLDAQRFFFAKELLKV